MAPLFLHQGRFRQSMSLGGERWVSLAAMRVHATTLAAILLHRGRAGHKDFRSTSGIIGLHELDLFSSRGREHKGIIFVTFNGGISSWAADIIHRRCSASCCRMRCWASVVHGHVSATYVGYRVY